MFNQRVTPSHRRVVRVKGDFVWEQSLKSKKHYVYRSSTGEKLLVSRYANDIEAFLRSGQKHSTPGHRSLLEQRSGFVLEQSRKTGKYYIYNTLTGEKLGVTRNRQEAERLFSYCASEVEEDFETEDFVEDFTENRQEQQITTTQQGDRTYTDYCKILNVNANQQLTQAEIKEAYRKMIAQYHPDRLQGLGVELQALAEAKTKEINEAYEYFKQFYDF